MGRYKVHLVLHYDALEIEAADTAELAKELDDRDIAVQLWEEQRVRPDRVVIDSFELEQPTGPLVPLREELTIDNGDKDWMRDLQSPGLTVDVRLHFSGIKVPVESVEAAHAWLADDEHLNSALIGLGHHSELTVRVSEPAEQPPSTGRWESSWRQAASRDVQRAGLTAQELSERLDQPIEADELYELLVQRDEQPAPRVHLALHGRLALTLSQKHDLRDQLDRVLAAIPTLNVPQPRS